MPLKLTHLVYSCTTSFQVVFVLAFSLILHAIRGSICIMFQRNGFENGFEKGVHLHQNSLLSTCPKAPRGRLTCAISNKKQQLELNMLFDFASIDYSNNVWNGVWIGFKFKPSKQMFEENEKDQCSDGQAKFFGSLDTECV